MRIRCWLIGCTFNQYDPYAPCNRCNTYGGEPEYKTGIYWILKNQWEQRRKPWRKCQECGRRRMWLKAGYCCSGKCYQTWMPF